MCVILKHVENVVFFIFVKRSFGNVWQYETCGVKRFNYFGVLWIWSSLSMRKASIFISWETFRSDQTSSTRAELTSVSLYAYSIVSQTKKNNWLSLPILTLQCFGLTFIQFFTFQTCMLTKKKLTSYLHLFLFQET